MVDVILNRASLEPLYPSADQKAGADIEALMRGLACLDQIVLRTHADLWTVPLVERENGQALAFAEIVASFYDTKDRHDIAAFFDELQRMAVIPIDAGLDDDQLELLLNCQASSPAPGHEDTFAAVQAAGIDALQCALTDGILASLCRDAQWEHDQMGFVDHQIEHPFIFDHIGTAAHGQAIAERRRQQTRSQLTKRNFPDLKGECFPHLRFGRNVDADIKKFSASLLGLAFKRLWALNEYSRKASTGLLSLTREEKERQGIKPETKETMDNYGKERNFPDSEGVTRTFEEHVWVDTLFRVHIFIHTEAPIIEIGYMGRHLRTVKHPT